MDDELAAWRKAIYEPKPTEGVYVYEVYDVATGHGQSHHGTLVEAFLQAFERIRQEGSSLGAIDVRAVWNKPVR